MHTVLILAATHLDFWDPFFKSRVSAAGAVCPGGAFSNVQWLVLVSQLGVEWYWHLEASDAAERPTTHTSPPHKELSGSNCRLVARLRNLEEGVTMRGKEEEN